MKKIIGLLVLLVSVYAYADGQVRSKQQLEDTYIANGSEGYDSFPWKTKLEEIFAIYPDAKMEEIDSGIKILSREGKSSNVSLTYYFFDEQLYKGQTVYLNTDGDVVNAVSRKLLDLYGKQDEKKTINDNGKTYYDMFEKAIRENFGKYNDYYLWKKTGWAVCWNKSATFKVELAGIDTYTADYEYYDYQLHDNSLSITYENPKSIRQIEQYQQQKKDEELKKKIENLDL